MAKPKAIEEGDEWVVFMRHLLGAQLRAVRLRLGFSLREAEARSGVTDSEIHKIETGQQDCRLESFVRLCAALGVPAGHVIDDTLTGNPAKFAERVQREPGFGAVCKVVRLPTTAAWLAINIGALATFAHQLLLTTSPARRAAEADYPTESLRDAFGLFAKCIGEMDGAERISIAAALVDKPMPELHRLKLLSPEILLEFIAAMVKREREQKIRKKGLVDFLGEGIWKPWLPPGVDHDSFIKAYTAD